jgi:hypothetical protein
MKQTYRDESILLFALLTPIISLMLILTGIKTNINPNKIIKQITDNRGYTSVIFVQDKDTVGLDYLTRLELDSLKTKLK